MTINFLAPGSEFSHEEQFLSTDVTVVVNKPGTVRAGAVQSDGIHQNNATVTHLGKHANCNLCLFLEPIDDHLDNAVFLSIWPGFSRMAYLMKRKLN